MCRAQSRKEQDLLARVSSGCLKTCSRLFRGVFSAYVFSTLTLSERSKETGVETKRQVALRQLTVQQSAETPEEKEKRKGMKVRWGHE